MKKQQGASLVGWLIILVLIGFIALVVIRLAPVYIESLSVKSVLDSLRDANLGDKGKAEIQQSLLKRLDMNDADSVKRENIKIEQVNGGLQITIDYDRRFPIIGNLDGIAHFNKQTLIRD